MSKNSHRRRASVTAVYNHTGVDQFEKLREIDPATLDFIPEYPVHVATIHEEYHAIVNALESEGYHSTLLNLEEDLSKLHRLLSQDPPDVVFNLVELFHGDSRFESAVSSMFELYRVPYTGSTAFALELCQRKALTKQILAHQGIATPGYLPLRSRDLPRRLGLSYPLIVKPSREDASLGVDAGSVVYNRRQLVRRVKELFEEFEPPILVEEFIAGKELHVSILGNSPPQVLPVIEFDFSALPDNHPAIITYNVKWNPLDQAYHQVHSICPARLPAGIEHAVKEQALRAYQATSCRDYARVDMRLADSGTPYVLEVNPNPDLTESVSFMQSAEKSGLTFAQTLARIAEFALARGKGLRTMVSQQGG